MLAIATHYYFDYFALAGSNLVYNSSGLAPAFAFSTAKQITTFLRDPMDDFLSLMKTHAGEFDSQTVGKLQERYGYGREQAEKEMNDFLTTPDDQRRRTA